MGLALESRDRSRGPRGRPRGPRAWSRGPRDRSRGHPDRSRKYRDQSRGPRGRPRGPRDQSRRVPGTGPAVPGTGPAPQVPKKLLSPVRLQYHYNKDWPSWRESLRSGNFRPLRGRRVAYQYIYNEPLPKPGGPLGGSGPEQSRVGESKSGLGKTNTPGLLHDLSSQEGHNKIGARLNDKRAVRLDCNFRVRRNGGF